MLIYKVKLLLDYYKNLWVLQKVTWVSKGSVNTHSKRVDALRVSKGVAFEVCHLAGR